MRGFDKLEEGRSRVLVYQVGSNRLYIVDYILGCYQMAVLGGLLDGSILDPSGCQQSLLDPVGSSWILVDLRWIHVYLSGSQLDPCVSSWILVYLSRAFIDLSISITRSLQILVDLQYIHLYLYIPTLSLSIHSIPINPLLSTLIHPIHLFYIF